MNQELDYTKLAEGVRHARAGWVRDPAAVYDEPRQYGALHAEPGRDFCGGGAQDG